MNSITLFQGKRLLLGVTGSIACYKAVDLASKLTQAGAEVDVIMTEAAGTCSLYSTHPVVQEQ